MKKILFITAFVPSDFTAGEKTTKIMLKELSQYFDVDLVYFKYANEKDYIPDAQNIRVVRTFKNSMLKKIINIILYPIVHPIFSVRFSWLNLYFLKRITRQNEYVGIVCNYSQTFLYSRYLDKSIPKFLYSMDVIAQRVSRTNGKIIQVFCRFSEKFCLSVKNASVFTVSDKDSALINQLYSIPAHTALAYVEDQILKSIPKKINETDYVFMGNWARRDNLDGMNWFFEKVAPLIDFDVTILIFGKFVPERIRDKETSHVKIKIMGFVDNPYEIISNSRAFLSPLFSGAGVKQKVFEALACGVPVIGNEIAFEGIDEKYDLFMFRFSNEYEFVDCMKRNLDLVSRIALKEDFIKSYQSETIPQFINRKLGE